MSWNDLQRRSGLMRREGGPFGAALLVSLVVHAGLLALALFFMPRNAPSLPFGSAVPVTIVSNAPMTDVSAALQGAQEADALTEEPIPLLPPELVAPPAPTPLPTEARTPTKPAEKARPAVSPGAKPQQRAELDFDALERRLQQAGGGKPRPAGGDKGPTRPATAPQPRPDGAGKGLNASSIQGLVDELNRRWRPNCDVEGGARVKLTVQVRISPSGQLLTEPRVTRGLSNDPMVEAAATKAKLAITASLPFRNLPEDYVGEPLNLNFDAQQACSA
jgi:protein TonB